MALVDLWFKHSFFFASTMKLVKSWKIYIIFVLDYFWIPQSNNACYKKAMFRVNFQVTICFNYFCNFRKKGPRSKWTIFKDVSDNSKKCLCVGNFRILSVVVDSLCRGLKYLLKIKYIILNYPNVAWFFIFETLCLDRTKTLTYILAYIWK